MKYLIVTADDLGLTKSINEGIAKACKEGIVTSVSVIPTGEAFDDAVETIKGLSFKGVGAHLALSETKPLLSSSKFYKNHNGLFFSLLLGIVKQQDIYTELKAQLELLRSKGLDITHINGHEHIHLIPQILDIFIQLAKEYGIPAIRFPRGDVRPKGILSKENYKSFVLNSFARGIENKIKTSGLFHTDFFMGLIDAGNLNIEKIKMMLENLKDGVTEIVTHPGFLSPEVLDRYSWHRAGETELFALTDQRIKDAIKDNNIQLISYETFLSLKKPSRN
ncbi:MAG: ChbG/HpnK family deacetylase [Candidatus Omnitrophota bacterium]|nr:ChbG/HpnK family deacetylase [Candidatus Omnitrophota bacterium]